MICTCNCRTSYCEKTPEGHSERCMNCGKVEYYLSPIDAPFGTQALGENFILFPRIPVLHAERHSSNRLGLDVGEY